MKRSARVLLVDDYSPFLEFLSTSIRQMSDLEIVGEATEGMEAVQKAQDLHPDLILLDIGLPRLNGIEAVRLIRKVSQDSKILMVSTQCSLDVVREALRSGASGCLVKSDIVSELRIAIETALDGRRFISTSVEGANLIETAEPNGSSF